VHWRCAITSHLCWRLQTGITVNQCCMAACGMRCCFISALAYIPSGVISANGHVEFLSYIEHQFSKPVFSRSTRNILLYSGVMCDPGRICNLYLYSTLYSFLLSFHPVPVTPPLLTWRYRSIRHHRIQRCSRCHRTRPGTVNNPWWAQEGALAGLSPR